MKNEILSGPLGKVVQPVVDAFVAEERHRIIAGLKRYGKHESSCDYYHHPCTCGFSDFVKSITGDL